MTSTAVDVVREFWTRMQSNDFASVASVLAPDFVLEWPQSRERIRGAERFVRMNAEYPAHGPWQFTIHRIVGDEREAVSDVSITDGVQQARAISFFETADGRVKRLVEFWPEPYEPPANRAHLVEPID
jgi:ketosteroid isomerase-like protein